jgi:hypothetical protein
VHQTSSEHNVCRPCAARSVHVFLSAFFLVSTRSRKTYRRFGLVSLCRNRSITKTKRGLLSPSAQSRVSKIQSGESNGSFAEEACIGAMKSGSSFLRAPPPVCHFSSGDVSSPSVLSKPRSSVSTSSSSGLMLSPSGLISASSLRILTAVPIRCPTHSEKNPTNVSKNPHTSANQIARESAVPDRFSSSREKFASAKSFTAGKGRGISSRLFSPPRAPGEVWRVVRLRRSSTKGAYRDSCDISLAPTKTI